jgi:hypothetical protein
MVLRNSKHRNHKIAPSCVYPSLGLLKQVTTEVPTLKLLTWSVPVQLNDRKDAFYEHLIQTTAVSGN